MSKEGRVQVPYVSTTNVAVAPSATIPGRPLELDMHRKAFRVQPDFPLDATVKLVSWTNPWRHNGLGWKFYETVLRHHPVSTVGELISLARPHGIPRDEAMEHLRWLFTWGGSYVEIGGRLYTPPPVAEMAQQRPRKKAKKTLAKAG